MKFNILMFAALKDFFPQRFILEIQGTGSGKGDSGCCSISEIRSELVKKNPASEELLKNCRAACDEEYTDDTFCAPEGSEIIFLPPSSGG